MASREDWTGITREILEKLDVEAEFRAAGLKITGNRASSKGWLACWASDRPEGDSPSAAVNVGDGPARGRYRDLGGKHEKLSFWDWMVQYGRYADFKTARREFAKKAGVKLPAGGEPLNPKDAIDFVAFSLGALRLWTERKGQITPHAAKEAGGVPALWSKTAPSHFQQQVIAFPGYGPHGTDADPIGWFLVNAEGGDIRHYQGKGKPPKFHKVHAAGGSQSSLLNQWMFDHLETAEVFWKVEGLSDMLGMQSIIPPSLKEKHLTFTNGFGASEDILQAWIRLFTKKVLWVVGDADEPGQAGVAKWVAHLNGHTAELRNVQLPYPVEPSHGKDVRDLIADTLATMCPGQTLEEVMTAAGTGMNPIYQRFLDLAAAATPVAPPAEATKPPTDGGGSGGDAASSSKDDPRNRIGAAEKILKEIGIDAVLGHSRGERSSASVVVRAGGRVHELPPTPRIQAEDLVTVCGVQAAEKIHDGLGEVSGRHRLKDVRLALALLGGRLRLGGDALGDGVWRAGCDIVIVSGPDAVVMTPGDYTLRPVTSPVVGGVSLDLRGDHPWVDFDVLQGLINAASQPQWCVDRMCEVIDLFKRWYWKRPIDAEVAAYLVVATWIQTLWSWRPEVAVTGAAGCGKTTLFDSVLKILFGRLTCYCDNPTEAGVRQQIGNRAVAVIIDEFESSVHRPGVLRLFRSSGIGSVVTRGGTDHNSKSFRIQHLPFFAGIEIGLVEEADKNRFITLDLGRVPRSSQGRLALPSAKEIRQMGMNLLAIGLRTSQDAMRHFNILKSSQIEGVHSRTVECYAVPSAVKSAIHNLPPKVAKNVLESFLLGKDFSDASRTDEDRLIDDILAASVMVGAGKYLNVSTLLTGDWGDEYVNALERCGIKKVKMDGNAVAGYGPDDDAFFVVPVPVEDNLLKPLDRWKGKKIKPMLVRCGDAILGDGRSKSQRHCAGRKPQGYVFPFAAFDLGTGERATQIDDDLDRADAPTAATASGTNGEAHADAQLAVRLLPLPTAAPKAHEPATTNRLVTIAFDGATPTTCPDGHPLDHYQRCRVCDVILCRHCRQAWHAHGKEYACTTCIARPEVQAAVYGKPAPNGAADIPPGSDAPGPDP